LRIRRHDGIYRWHLVRAEPIRAADGTITQWVGTNTDIEDQKTAAQALVNLNDTLEQRVLERTREVRMAEARFRGIFDSTQQLIALLTLDGFVLEVNRAATLAGDASIGEILGKPAWDAPCFRRAPAGGAVLRAALPIAAAGEFVRSELDLLAADDQIRTFDFSMGPVRDDQNNVVMLVLEGRDITERKQLEEQLRQSQKMEAVGQLTGGLAHDFNNLLTGIIGSLELLRTRMSQGRMQDLERYIAAASGAADRAAALTHRLLAFSRRQTLDPRPTNMNRLVFGMEELVRRTMGPAIRIEIVTAPDCWNTMVDPPQLENALLNLCINARDAMPDGGSLIVETGNIALAGAMARTLDLPAGSYVYLRVSDTGSGMEPDVAARAFDPFFTTKPIGMGTGLGLSMIYGFVRQSGGQARIASQPGLGTTVTLYLPRHAGSEETEPFDAAAVRAPRAEQGETVLVVDDEPTVRMLVTEVLADLGYHAIEAVDGPAGLSVLRSAARIDLLITDVGLPGGMNGRQLADAARTGRPDLKVLFITGYAEAAVIGEGRLDPGMHMLTKPFAMDALAGAVKQTLGTTAAA
jgi:PAS domain S-box-containing protein